MKNTPYAISEATDLVTRLLARTEENKITWSDRTEFFSSPGAPEVFEAELEGEVKVSISSDQSTITFAVALKRGLTGDRVLLFVSLEHDPSFGYDLPGESELHDSLTQLQELARRSALKVDQNLAKARDFLERLAG
jgi:hypothetical protein